MTDTWTVQQRRKLLVGGLGWCLCLALWTAALLTTSAAEIGKQVTPSGMYFPASKLLHLGGYGFLTIYLSWLPLGRWRWLLLAILSLHTAGTEFGQTFVPGRTGTPTDVAIDHLGLLLGLTLTWKRWAPRSVRRLQLSVNQSER